MEPEWPLSQPRLSRAIAYSSAAQPARDRHPAQSLPSRAARVSSRASRLRNRPRTREAWSKCSRRWACRSQRKYVRWPVPSGPPADCSGCSTGPHHPTIAALKAQTVLSIQLTFGARQWCLMRSPVPPPSETREAGPICNTNTNTNTNHHDTGTTPAERKPEHSTEAPRPSYKAACYTPSPITPPLTAER